MAHGRASTQQSIYKIVYTSAVPTYYCVKQLQKSKRQHRCRMPHNNIYFSDSTGDMWDLNLSRLEYKKA